MVKKIGLPLIAFVIVMAIIFTVDDATVIGELVDPLEFIGLALASAYMARNKK